MLGPQLLGQAQSQVRAVHHHDLSRALGPEHLVGDVAKAAKPDDHREVAGLKDLSRLAGRVIGREAGVGVRSDLLRRNAVGKVDQVSFLDLEVLRKAAVPGDAGERAVLAMHVVAPATSRAGTIRDEGVYDHRVALLEVAHPWPHAFHPAGIFVSRGVRKLNAHLVAPDALDDVQVGPAEPSPPDPDNHVIGVLDLWIRDLFHLEELRAMKRRVVLMEPRNFHSTNLLTACLGSAARSGNPGISSDSPYRVLSMPRQNAALNSTERRVRWACSRRTRNSDRSMGLPSGCTKAGAVLRRQLLGLALEVDTRKQRPRRIAASSRRDDLELRLELPAEPVPDAGVPDAAVDQDDPHPEDRILQPPQCEQGPEQALLSCEKGLDPEGFAQLVQIVRCQQGEGFHKGLTAVHPVVDLLVKEVILQLNIHPFDPGQFGHPFADVGRHHEGKVGRTPERGKAKVHGDRVPIDAHTADKPEFSERLIQLGIVHLAKLTVDLIAAHSPFPCARQPQDMAAMASFASSFFCAWMSMP